MFKFSLLAVLLVCLLSSGCIGFMAVYSDTVTIKDPKIYCEYLEGPAETENILSTKALIRNWGSPEEVEKKENGQEVWTYYGDWKMYGTWLMVVIVPIPLFVPFDSEYVSFVVEDNQIKSTEVSLNGLTIFAIGWVYPPCGKPKWTCGFYSEPSDSKGEKYLRRNVGKDFINKKK